MAGAVSEAKYTPEQREAVYRLFHEEHKTAPEAVALAADGVYGLEPFCIPEAEEWSTGLNDIDPMHP